MTAALLFTTVELRMLTNAHDASKIRYGASTAQAGSATTSSSCCILDESGWIGVYRGTVIPRFFPNVHDYIYGVTKNEPDAATVELRFRPHPQSITIHPEIFKRLKTVVALSWRSPNHQYYSRITTVRLRFTPTHHDLIIRGES